MRSHKHILTHTHILFISPVFYEFPDSTTVTLHKNSMATITCGVKTLKSANVYWILNQIPITNSTDTCADNTVHSSLVTESSSNDYELVNNSIYFCNVTEHYNGILECIVEIEDDIASRMVSIDVIEQPHSTSPSSSFSNAATPVINSNQKLSDIHVVLIVVIPVTFISIVIIILVYILVRYRAKQRKSVPISSTNVYEMTHIDISGGLPWEYPRTSLHYIEEIGSGRFGRIYKAEACNIIRSKHAETSTETQTSTVAVKTLKEGEALSI